MIVRLPSTYQPDEWDSLTDEQRQESIALAAWYRENPDLARERLQNIREQIEGLPDDMAEPTSRAELFQLMTDENALEAILDDLDNNWHDEGGA